GDYPIKYIATSYEYGEYVSIVEGKATLTLTLGIESLREQIRQMQLALIANTILILIIFIVIIAVIARKKF
ncbi:MAG: hypothetical protein AB1485_08725, partial [Candidatus Thermoplasmatota archaeon]